MAGLSARERAKLPDSAFASIDSSGKRLLPIHDEAHVRNALARFNRILFEDEEARDRARSRLLRAAKRHGIVPVGFIEGQLRPKLPTGQLTLLFADLEGSTGLVTELADRYRPMLNAVRRIQRRALRATGGYEVDAHGDELFAVFEHAPAALDAALAMTRGMRDHAWPEGHAVRARIGLHTGRPTLTVSTYHGLAVNTAARFSALGHGGQILVSRTTHAQLAPSSEIELRLLGTHRMRGIPDAHEVYQVVVPDLPAEFPPLRLDR